jgi:hypothetical protein
MKWYVKNSDGKVFGPVDDAKLLAWVRDGRVEPFAGISNDLKTWRLASLEPSLEMDWIVENEPGRFYGPTNRAVVDDLITSKSLAPGYRIYRDDHGGAMEKEAAAARAEAEKAMAEVQGEAEKAMDELKAEAERTLAAKDSELAAKDSEMAALKGEIEAMRAKLESQTARADELEAKLAKLTEAKQREWTAEVVEPEIVSDAPPPTVRDIFKAGGATLADLERQAQAELARMGATGAKKFFKIKR